MNESSVLQRVFARLFRPSQARPSYFESLEPRLLLSAVDGVSIPPSDWRDTPALQGVFERNVGQASAEYEYFARGFGYDLSLARDEVVIDLKSGAAQTAADDAHASETPTLRMHWLDAQDPLSLSGRTPASGLVNYLDVDDPARSVLGAPMFGEVFYDEVYAGIDLVFYERDGFMEFDWIVEAGAEPGAIRMSYEGADDLALDESGQLLISTPLGLLIQRAPVLYQTIAGERVAVDGAYQIEPGGIVSFSIGDYDLAQALVIDPVLDFGKTLGGSARDEVSGVVVDASGAIYVTGTTRSEDFPVTSDAFQSSLSGADRAAYVTKLDPAGDLVWSTYITLSNANPDRVAHLNGVDLALDASGNIYIAGYMFDETFGAPASAFNGNENIWIAKLDSTGLFLHYATTIAGKTSIVESSTAGLTIDVANAIAVDAEGRAYVVGYTNSTDLPVTSDALDVTLGTAVPDLVQFDPFLAILEPNGSVAYLSYLGGSLNDFANAVAIDDLGNIVIAGSTVSPNYPVTVGAVRLLNLSSDDTFRSDGFVTLLDPISRNLRYSTLIGAGGEDFINDIAVRGRDIYLTGTTVSPNFPLAEGARMTPHDGFGSAFVARLVPNLEAPEESELAFATVFGGSSVDSGAAIAVDDAGQIHVGGETRSRDFILADPHQAQIGGLEAVLPGMAPEPDAFVARFSADGRRLIYSTYLGGSDADGVSDIAVDPSGRTIAVGNTGALPLGGIGQEAFIAALSARTAIAGRPLDASAGIPFTAVVATFDVVNPLRKAEDYKATIDWGDGSASVGTLVRRTGLGPQGGEIFEVLGTHTYVEPGAYPIVVRVAGLVSDHPVNNINVSQQPRSQTEPRVAIDPSRPDRLFMTALDEGLLVGEGAFGLFTARSLDGGRTWSPAIIADGRDGMRPGRSIGASTFDSIGNLVLAYAGADGNSVVVTVSRDGGRTFSGFVELHTDGPPAVAGSSIGSIAIALEVSPFSGVDDVVWVAFNDPESDTIRVYALQVSVFGELEVESTHVVTMAQDGHRPGPVDIAVGPDGHVVLLWHESAGIGAASATIYAASRDEPAFAPFGIKVPLGTTRFPVPQFTGPEMQLAWDTADDSPHRGRLYAVGYDVGEFPGDPPVTRGLDVFVQHSDDHGMNWSSPVFVNNDAEAAIQFLPSIAIDPLSGHVAVGWYDARENPGDVETRYAVAISTDGGQTFGPNVAISNAPSASNDPDLTEFGFFLGRGRSSALTFIGGVLTPLWADNGASVIARTDPPHYEVLTAIVGVAEVAVAPVKIRPNGIDIVLGESFSGQVATFTHDDPARAPEEFEALIGWGDDPSVQTIGQITQPGGPGTAFVVIGTHLYERTGAFPLSIAVHDLTHDVFATPLSNVTARAGSQTQGSIAIDPTDPNRVVAAGIDADGVVVSISSDGGVTWASRLLDVAELPEELSGEGLLHPVLAFDRYGNLFLAVVDTLGASTVVLASTDGGARFDRLLLSAPATILSPPLLATGPGQDGTGDSLWLAAELNLAFEDGSLQQQFQLAHLPVFGRGMFGASPTFHFVDPTFAQGAAETALLGDIEVGPLGEVMLAYLTPAQGSGGVTGVLSMVDPDGIGPLDFESRLISVTTVDAFQTIPPQDVLGITALPRLAWDRAIDSMHFNRVYAVFTTSPGGVASHDVTPVISWSDDGGLSWVFEARALDTAYPERFGFYPDIAVDQVTGAVAAGWYGFSEDDGLGATRYSLTTFLDVDLVESAAVIISPGLTRVTGPDQDALAQLTQYGRFSTIAIAHGVAQPIWSDGSGKLGGDADPPRFELGNARIGVVRVAPEPLQFLPIEQEIVEGMLQPITFARFADPNPEPVEDYHASVRLFIDGSVEVLDAVVSLEEDGAYRVAVEEAVIRRKGEYAYSVEIQSHTVSSSHQGNLLVKDAPLELVVADRTVSQNQGPTQATARMVDDNPYSTHSQFSVLIDWGDGTQSAGAFSTMNVTVAGVNYIVTGDNTVIGYHELIGGHLYAEGGVYTVTFTVTEDDGTVYTDSGTYQVGSPLQPHAEILFVGALQGTSTGPTTLGVFSAPSAPPVTPFNLGGASAPSATGLGDHPDAYSAEVDWGDGTPVESASVTVDALAGTVTVSGDHTYALGGSFEALITLRDDSGGEFVTSALFEVASLANDVVLVETTGVVLNPATGAWVGELRVRNASAAPLSGPLHVRVTDLADGVTLTNAQGLTADGDPFLYANIANIAPGALSAPIELIFSNPDAVALDYHVDVFAGGMAIADSSAGTTGFAALAFELNAGQSDAVVDYLARGAGYAIFLTGDGAVVALHGIDASQDSAAVRMQWLGSNSDPAPIGIDAQAGVSHYLIGDDPEAWITDVPRYARVEYRDVYAGIDLAYYGRDGALEYDWIVDPGADYTAIRMGYAGIDGLGIDAAGDLILAVGDVELVQRAPYAYQRTGDAIHVIDSAFVLLDATTVGFTLGAYDPSLPLVIDPVLAYSTFFGGSAHDAALAVATDAEGNTYVAGRSASADFPLEQALDPENARAGILGRMDAVIVKLDADGLPVYSTYLGGVRSDQAYGLAVDKVGQAVVVGSTAATDFPVTDGAYQADFDGSAAHGFIAKLSAAGDALLFATLDGAFGQSRELRDVKIGADGLLYVVGNAFTGQDNGYLAVFSADGSARLAARVILGDSDTRLTALEVDPSGAVFVAGSSQASDVATPGALQTELASTTDAFIARFDHLLADHVFATYYGGAGRDVAMDIVRDRDGNLVVVGQTESADLPTRDPLQGEQRGASDAFILRLASDGSAVLDASYFGGTDDDLGLAVAIDANNRVVLAGQTASADFPLMHPVQSVFRGGPVGTLAHDAFVTVLDLDSNAIAFSTFLGGTHAEHIAAVAVGEDGMLHLAGQTRSADLRLVNAPQSAYGGGSFGDMLIARIDPAGHALPVLTTVAVNAVEGIAFAGPVAIFSDRDDDTAADYQAVIDWGDGSSSDGTVAGADGSFTILGQHLYERYGAYPLRVTLTDKSGASVTASGQAASAATGVLRYAIEVDTSSLAGSEGLIRLQLNPGRGTGLEATAVVEGFAGGVLLGSEMFEGDVSGSLATGLMLINTAPLNQYNEAIRFGDSISFTLALTGPALDPAAFSLLGSSFALQLLRSDATPVLSDDASGAMMRIDLGPAGTAQLVDLAADAATLRFGIIAQANVADAPIAAHEVPIAVSEDATFTVMVATFTDSNPFGTLDEFSALVDWGDGTRSAGVISEIAPGSYAVTGTHRYADAGQYALITTVTSAGGQVAITSPGATAALAGLQAAPVVVPAAVAGDLDGDGILDLVTTRVVSLGRGDGTFEAPLAHGALFTEGVALADFDGDGILDIAGHERRTTGGVLTILLGNGDGSFSILGERATPNPQGWLVLTDDLDHDGNADIVLAAPSGYNAIPILFGNGDGSFGTTGTLSDFLLLPTLLGANVPELADVDGDAINDLVVRDLVNGVTQVFINRGDRTFQALPVLTGFRGLAGDVTGDGIVDLVSDDGRLRAGNGDGSFADAVPLTTSSGEPITSVTALADLDGDGVLDLLGAATISLPQATSYTVVRGVLNDGSGGFGPFRASAVYAANPLSLFDQSTGTMRFPLLGDFNGDGRIDLIDRSQLLLGLGDGAFASARVYPAGAPGGGSQPSIIDVAAADLNLDGIDDMILLNESVNDTQGLIVLLGTANGDFEPALRYPYGMVIGGNGTFNLAIADLNVDGVPDVIVGSAGTTATGGNGRLSVLFGQKDAAGNATGALGAPTVYTLSGEARVYAVGHFNADQLPDVLIARGTGNVLLRNDPINPGALLVPTGTIGITGFVHAVGDVNNDGALDLVLPGSARINVHLGRLGTDSLPNGLFLTTPVATALSFNTFASAVADLNGDGTLDLVTVHEFTSGNDLIGVRFGVGDGSFGPGTDYPVAVDAFDFSGFDDLLLEDIDGDGWIDIVAERANPDLVTVLSNRGGGVFGPAVTYANGAGNGGGFALAVGDFNGDGAKDIATANDAHNTFSVLFNASALVGATVLEVNDAPVFTTAPPTRAIVGQLYEHLLRIDDPDDGHAPDDLTLAIVTLPAWLQLIDRGDGSATLTGTPGLAELGAHPVELRIADPNGATTTLALVVTVVEGNAAPSFASIPALTVDERTHYRYAIAVTDADAGDSAIVLADALPSWLTLLDAGDGTAVLAGEPGAGEIGVHAVTLRAVDLAGVEATQAFSITVGDVNDPPHITSTPVTDAEEDQPYVYVVTAADPDAGDSLAYLLTQRPRGMAIDPVTGRIDWTPDDDQVIPQRVVVRATDAAGAYAEQSFLVAVSGVNDAPVFDSVPATTAQSGRVYLYQPIVSDADVFDEVGLSLLDGPPGMSLSPDTGVLAWTPTRDQLGEHVVILRAEDAAGSVVLQTFTLTVTLGNGAPVIVSNPPVLVDEQTDYVYPIAAIDEDPEDTALTYALVLGPAGMQVDVVSGALAWQPQAADLGIHAVTVRVSDAQGAFAEQAYLLTVANVNEAPQFISVPPGAALVGGVYAYAAQAIDPDAGDHLTYSIQDAPENVVLLPAQGLLLWRPGSTQTGTQSITLRVSDTAGLIDEQAFTVAVSAQNIAPVAEDDAYTVPANEPFVIAAPGVLANDGDANGDALTARLLELPLHGTLTFDSAGGFSYTPAAGFAGEDRFTYVVNDATADSAPATVALDVQPVQIPIEVSLHIPDFMRGPGQPVDVPAALADGLPMTLVAADAVWQLHITVHFDPTLLTITGAALVSGLPAGATLQIDLGTAGLVVIEIESATALPAGTSDLLRLHAEVPLGADYAARHVFTMGAVMVNGLATAQAPTEVLHLVGYLGDIDGDETYTIADVTGIQQMVIGLIGAFDFWTGVDPLLVADIDANGFITSRDATRVNQELNGFDRPELPPIPDRSTRDLAPARAEASDIEASTMADWLREAPVLGAEHTTAADVAESASGMHSIESDPATQSQRRPGLLSRLFAALKARLLSDAGESRDLYAALHTMSSPIAVTIGAHESVRTLTPGVATQSIVAAQYVPESKQPWLHRFVTNLGSAVPPEADNQTLRVSVPVAQNVIAEVGLPLSTE